MTKKQPTKTPQKPARRSRTPDELQLDEKWGRHAAQVIRNALKRRKVTIAQLAEMLTAHGRPTEEQLLKNALTRGQFKAAWFLDVMTLLGEKDIKI